MGASGLVHTWAVDTSEERTCVFHRLHWCEEMDVGVSDGERKSLCPSRCRNGGTHTTRYALLLRCLDLYTLANIHIGSLQTFGEAAFIAYITFSKVERIKERKRK